MNMPESYDDLIGKPWALGETGPDSFDCFGLAVEVLARLGYDLDAHISDQWIRNYLPGQNHPDEVTSLECTIDEIPRKPGDLIVMRGLDTSETDDARATHVAVFIGQHLVIQSCRGKGVHIVPFSRVEPYTVEVITWVSEE